MENDNLWQTHARNVYFYNPRISSIFTCPRYNYTTANLARILSTSCVGLKKLEIGTN